MRLLPVFAAFLASAIAETYEKAQYYQYRGPAAPLSDEGMVVDTPEVARARAAHLAMYAQTMARLRKQQNDYEKYEATEMPMMQKRPGPRTYAPLGRDGRVVDTAEVAQAKAAHLAAHSRAASQASSFYELDVYQPPVSRKVLYLTPVRLTYAHVPTPAYRGVPAPVGPDGRVIETPEVMRAREAHVKAHARALALSAQHDATYY